jgi:hypothetical protein
MFVQLVQYADSLSSNYNPGGYNKMKNSGMMEANSIGKLKIEATALPVGKAIYVFIVVSVVSSYLLLLRSQQ